MTNRRQLLTLGATAAFSAFIPRLSSAAGGRDPRFVTIILRGALDGLTAVPPAGDPDYAALRGDLPVEGAIPLDSTFSLHPSMNAFARQYKAGQALVIHAAASPYRERSHFDGQDVLESGMTAPGHTDSGWMNRFLRTLPGAQTASLRGLGVGGVTPLVMRGQAPVLGWAPATLKPVDADLPPRLLSLYQATDPLLASTLTEAIATGKIVGAEKGMVKAGGGPGDPKTMIAMAEGAAKLLAQPDGPRIAALAFEGWDTHAQEKQRLANLLGGLDGALAAFETGLGPAWRDTAILVITEFGRTAAVNGTGGTDHGTAAAAFMAGGAVKGGRVIADWPGLKTGQLYEARDLKPTTDLRGVMKGIMADLYAVPESALSRDVFPDSAGVRPMSGLIA
ncbi:hypothetical protein AEAC466_04005 [Asticcacaulis sp. AC466]|uniref:DUF1501 domain-containing protein n=1 Tax=Asticcacaulis sp. AC466 TaxID=1282362 RepID=UPI0003C3E1C0|nr:DUF1501 domain-containing protein [Asticcacaulis sp. AC466]ESQ86373.1 hypothetical protein AEAC466_04005 [Asticcacaulis sp. AC466]